QPQATHRPCADTSASRPDRARPVATRPRICRHKTHSGAFVLLIPPTQALAAVGAEGEVDPANAETALAIAGRERLGLLERDAGCRPPVVAIGGHLGQSPALLLRDHGQHAAARNPQPLGAQPHGGALRLHFARNFDVSEYAALLL